MPQHDLSLSAVSCLRCSWTWYPRKLPIFRCPRCGTVYWNVPTEENSYARRRRTSMNYPLTQYDQDLDTLFDIRESVRQEQTEKRSEAIANPPKPKEDDGWIDPFSPQAHAHRLALVQAQIDALAAKKNPQ